MAASDHLNPQQFYHGTGNTYEVGQIIPKKRTYYTPNRPLAAAYSPNMRTGHVYRVEPVKGHTPDPEYPEGVSYYAGKVRVVGEANNSMIPEEGEKNWWVQ